MKVAPAIVISCLTASIAFGLCVQSLLMSRTVGLNLSVIAIIAIAILALVKWRKVIDPDVSIGYLVFPLALASYGFGFPDSRNLVQLNAVVGFLCVSYYCFRVCARRPLTLVESAVKTPFIGAGIPLAGVLVPFLADWKAVKLGKKSLFSRSIALGLLFAVPFLLFFGMILGQADPIFAKIFEFRFNIDAEAFFTRSFIFGFAMCSMAGTLAYLSKPLFDRIVYTLNPPRTNPPPYIPYVPAATTEAESATQDEAQGESPAVPTVTQIAPPEVKSEYDLAAVFLTFFGLISILFGIFMLVQIRYLFGGESVVLRTQGLTYAAYAKRGFLEIASVESVCIPLLVFAQYQLREQEAKRRKLINIQILVVIGLLLMLMASAALRLKLYVDAYGFTPLRFYVAAGMVWLLSILFAYARYGTAWQLDKIGKFVYASMVGVTLCINLARPDYWIARVSLTRKESQGFDTTMVTGAGADAYSAIKEFAGEARTIPGSKQTLMEAFLDNQRRRSHDWRDMTFSQYALPKP